MKKNGVKRWASGRRKNHEQNRDKSRRYILCYLKNAILAVLQLHRSAPPYISGNQSTCSPSLPSLSRFYWVCVFFSDCYLHNGTKCFRRYFIYFCKWCLMIMFKVNHFCLLAVYAIYLTIKICISTSWRLETDNFFDTSVKNTLLTSGKKVHFPRR